MNMLKQICNIKNLNERELYLQNYSSEFRIAVDITGYEKTNKFISEFINLLKQYHPFELTEPNRCYFSKKRSENYKLTDSFKFDIENPVIPNDVFNNLENERFRISLADNGINPFCFWLVHSSSNIHDIFFKNDNAGKGFLLQIQCINPIVYREIIKFIFSFGHKVKSTKV